ncbi:MAG: glycosyltransferase [Anaerolineae bacterium]|nr:glycosyltransferase [Anaerolineae bacterium]
MKHLLIGMGTRGDVQPLVALAEGMQKAGLDVTIGAGLDFEAWIRGRGIPFAPMNMNMQAMMNSPEGVEWINNSKNPMQEGRNMKRMLDKYSADISEDLRRICEDADILISNLPTFGFVAALAEKMHKPHWLVLLSPLTPSNHPASTMKPMTPFTAPMNRVSGYIGLYFTQWVAKASTNIFRQKLGLAPWGYRDYLREWTTIPVLYGVSEQVMPRDPRWHDKTFVTGYWIDRAPANYTPPAPLADFLRPYERTVYIGFGSMSTKDPSATAHLIIDAVKKVGIRAIVYSGWAGLRAEKIPDNIFLLDGAPHDWLFPQLSGVIHHGGAGTTAAGLRAGVPSGVVSHMADQPYWGRRVAELKVGVPFIYRHKLTADKLARMIDRLVNTPELEQNAYYFGERLRAEDGVKEAVRVIQQLHQA